MTCLHTDSVAVQEWADDGTAKVGYCMGCGQRVESPTRRQITRTTE